MHLLHRVPCPSVLCPAAILCARRVMNVCVVLLVLLSAVAARAEEGEEAAAFVPPTQPAGDVYFFETFNDEEEFNTK